MVIKNITKFTFAIVLTVAVTCGSGVVGEEIGLDIMPVVHAGSCSTSGGGGC